MAKVDIAGLLTGIGSAPIDPMAGATPFEMQRQLQREFGGTMRKAAGDLFGIETRTPQEQAQAALAQLDPSKKEDRGKIIQIVSRIDPSRVPALREAFTLRDTQEAKSSGLRNATKKAIIQKYGEEREDLLALADQGLSLKDIDSFAETDAEDRYKVVGNNVLDITTGKFLPPPPGTKKGGYTVSKFFDPEKNANVVQFLDKEDPTKVLREVLDVVDTKGETATIAKIRKESLDNAFEAATAAREATRVANEFEKVANQISSGALATVEEQFKALAGLQDETTLLRLSANRLRLGRAIENLPQGPATDKDVALVLAGELPDNAAPETVVSYARGLAKLARREQEYFNKEATWLDLYGNQRGFSSQIQKEALEETLASIPADAIAQLEADPTPQNIQFFNQTFGVDYLDITQKLELANRTLTKLKRGFE